MPLDKLFALVENMRRRADVKAVFGRPQQVEGRTLIPIARVSYMAYMRFGEDQPPGEEPPIEEGGAGGMVSTKPLAVLEITPEETRMEPIVDEGKLTLGILVLVGWVALVLGWSLSKIFGARK